MRSRWTVMAALIAGASLGAPAFAQSDRPTLETWRAAVAAHVPGQRDAAVTSVSAWTKSDLSRVLDAYREASTTQAPDERDAWLRRAILLHTDILVLLRQPIGYALPPSDDRSVGLVADGVQLGVQRGTVQWEFVRRLVDELGDADAARQWYRATAAFLQSWLDWPESSTHLAQARRRFPDDPVLLMYEGTVHETYASPAIQTLEPPKALMTPEPVHFATGSVFSLMNMQRPIPAIAWIFQPAEVEAQDAERLLRQAVAADPDLAEAQIRLGHVLGLRGQHTEAIESLQRGLAATSDPVLRYWAFIWLAREQRAAGQVPAAEQAFADAAALFPEAPTPRLGRSQLLYDRGERERALDEYAAALSGGGGAEADPRLTYEHAHVPSADALIATMRSAFETR